jgi:hypothetical protein
MGFVHIAPDGAGIFKARRVSPETKLAKYELEKAMPTGAFARVRPRVRTPETAGPSLQQLREKGKAAFGLSVN